MARPKTDTVIYFAHDVDASSKRTLAIIERCFGTAGYAFWFKLLEWLGGSSEGHYFDGRKPTDMEFLTGRCGSDAKTGIEILQKLAELGAIDAVLWEHNIIWSQNFIDRLAEVYKRRGRELPLKPSFCVGNCKHLSVSSEITGSETPVSDPEMPQSKVNKSKVNKTKEKKTTAKEIIPVFLSSEKADEEDYVYEAFEQHIGDLTPVIREGIKTALTKYTAVQVSDACKEAATKPHDRTWPYVMGILHNWAREGRAIESGPSPGDPDKYHHGKFSHLVRG